MKNRNSELMEMLEYLELFALEERFRQSVILQNFHLLILFSSFRNLFLQNMITEKKTVWTDFSVLADLERIPL